MKLLARWAWVAVLGTALALSWWSLDALARHYGMPAALAGMVSATFDGAALVAADLAVRRARDADSAAAVKALMFCAVALSAWLNFEHGALLHYPTPVRVLFASPAVISGSLFELQVRSMHRVRLHELGRVPEPAPQFGLVVWALHPLASLRRMSQITASRLHSVPLTVMDWTGARPVAPAPSGAPADEAGSALAHLSSAPSSGPQPSVTGAVSPARQPHPRAIPDEYYAARLREVIEAAGGAVPSARAVARQLSVGQDRARRLLVRVAAGPQTTNGA